MHYKIIKSKKKTPRALRVLVDSYLFSTDVILGVVSRERIELPRSYGHWTLSPVRPEQKWIECC